jgi:uncharacterized protein with NRDE domain
VLSANDAASGGTWMGINAKTGSVAALTNVRAAPVAGQRSRGELVNRVLAGHAAAAVTSDGSYSSYNLLYGNLCSAGRPNLSLSVHTPPNSAGTSADLPAGRPFVAAKSNDHGGAWTQSSSDPLHECTWPKCSYVCTELEKELARRGREASGEAGAKLLLEVIQPILSAMALPEPFAQRAAAWKPAEINHLPAEIELKLQAGPFVAPFELPGTSNGVVGPGADDFQYGTVSQSFLAQCRSEGCVFYAYRAAPDWTWEWRRVPLPDGLT